MNYNIDTLLDQFEQATGQQFTVGGTHTPWRDEDGSCFPKFYCWDTVRRVDRVNQMVIGDIMEANVDICRLKQEQPQHLKVN